MQSIRQCPAWYPVLLNEETWIWQTDQWVGSASWLHSQSWSQWFDIQVEPSDDPSGIPNRTSIIQHLKNSVESEIKCAFITLLMILSWMLRSTCWRKRMPSRRTLIVLKCGPVWTSCGSSRPTARSCTWFGTTPSVSTDGVMSGLRAAFQRRTNKLTDEKLDRSLKCVMWSRKPVLPGLCQKKCS